MNQVTLFRDNQTGLAVLRLTAKRRAQRVQNGTYQVSEILGKYRTTYEGDVRDWLGYCTYVIRQGERIVYVGMSNYGPRTRLRQHKRSGKPAIKQVLAQPETVIDVTFYDTHADAAEAERLLIDRLAPEVNER